MKLREGKGTWRIQNLQPGVLSPVGIASSDTWDTRRFNLDGCSYSYRECFCLETTDLV